MKLVKLSHAALPLLVASVHAAGCVRDAAAQTRDAVARRARDAGVVANARADARADALAPPADSAHAVAPAAVAPRTLDFNAQTVGGPSPDFEAVVGDWLVAEGPGGARGLRVDGSRWRQGTPSANLADQARRLYGERYAEFLDGVRAFAFYPLAVDRTPPPSGDLRISVRFYPQDGRIDQAAGIAFGIQPNGTYLGVRANALEDNILYFRVVRGRRTVLENIRSVPTPSRTWHTLVLSLRGRRLTATLDGIERLARDLDAPPTGRVGLWSKADSQVLFDDFEVRPLR